MTLERFAPQLLSLLRFFAGTMFACHGAQKLLGAFGGLPPGVPMDWQLWTAGIIELVGGALIAIGLFTRSAAFLSSGLMAFAYFIGHAKGGFWPKTNGGEMAVLYCWLFLYLAASGPGPWSLDALVKKWRA